MLQKKITISLCLALSFTLSCHSQVNDFLSKAGKVAEKKGELTVCDYSLLKETVTIPLSALTEELQLVKLDNADEALVKESDALISDNYILVRGSSPIPYKLFDKKTGKFITNIGAFGQGPGEYQNIYDQQLDEENNRIYLLPWNANKILSYDLKGNFIGPVPLCISDISNDANYLIPKSVFRVDTKAGTLIVASLPDARTKAIVWQQSLDGKMLKSIDFKHLKINPNGIFNNEMYANKTKDFFSFNIFTFEPRTDSLYYYDVSQSKLIPVFTMDFKNIPLSIHHYAETKKYYLGDFSEPKKENEYITTTQNQRFYIIDKNTLKGSFFTLENDYLGGISIEWPSYQLSGDYYIYNIEPGRLSSELEKVLTNNKLTPEMKSKLTKLKDSISENDNNYIFYAKCKE